MNPSPVSVVIPNYNGERILIRNLKSVVKAVHAYSGDCEVIVVDDASKDNSVALITEKFSQIKIILHDINKGFSEAVHTGVQSAAYPIIVLLNSDVRPDRDFIAPLIQWFSRHEIFSVSPLILDEQRNPLRVSWVLGKLLRGEIRKRNWDLEVALDMVSKGQVLKSLCASGGSMAFRRDRFIALQGFLPLYKPFYGEDIDLGIRAWKHGWQTVFEPRSTVVHDHAGTIKRFFSNYKIRITRRRNRFFYLWLHLSTRKLIYSHFLWIFWRLLLRLLKMDVVYPIALFKALSRLRAVIQLRRTLEPRKYKPSLEEIFETIRLATIPRSKPASINKVIFIGKSKKKTGNTRYMLNALRRRVEIVTFISLPRHKKVYLWTDYQKVIYKKIIRANPDLVLIYSKDIPYPVLRKIRTVTKTAIFFPDVVIPLDEKFIQYARLVDYLFITNKRQINELKSLGVRNPIFCMQGCDRDEHRIVAIKNRKWASEVAFIGRPSTEYRISLLKKINREYHLKAWGGPWQELGFNCPKKRVYPKEYAMICYATPIILGCDYNHELDCNFSNRTWITLGCGGFLLTNYVPVLEDLFTKGVHLEWYRNQEECLDLIAYYLKHESQRKKIALNGYEFAHTHRTYDVVIDEIISCIENDQKLQ